MRKRTTVGIVGAGPAGLLLGNILLREGIDCVVLEQRSREYVEQRARAGLIEHRTVQLLVRLGLADGLLAVGAKHTKCEFRYQGQRFSVPYGELTSGAAHYVYPQQNLVRDLIASFLGAGGDLRFESPVSAVAEPGSDNPVLVADGLELGCDFVVGADGYYSAVRAGLPATAFRPWHKQHPFRWLTILAAAPPSTTELIYALHEDGFAGHMLRTPEISRFYLQCGEQDTVADWPDDRIWQELRHRLAVDEDWQLHEGPVLEKGQLDMRTFVCTPMRVGRVFLAGDAAHVITPAGGKGMNLALGDASALATAFIGQLRHNDSRLLDGYSDSRLRAVWRTQQFSDWLLNLINKPSGDAGFDYQLQLAQLDDLRTRRTAAQWFAESYVGVA